MTDFLILEEMQKMIKEIPRPRLLFKKGVTVKGFFRPYMSLSDYTEASVFKDSDVITPVKVRFSSMLGDNGTADTKRNVKGMAVKFDVGDEVYDIICHNMPANMINDKGKLIDLIKVFLIKDKFDGINIEAFWRYVLANKEALAFALMLYSGLGIYDSFIDIKYYTVNSYIWRNRQGHEVLVRYKWVPIYDEDIAIPSNSNIISNNRAEFIAGFDPDRAYNGLINNIKNGKYPMFELYISMIDKTVPYMCAGVMILDKIAEQTENDSICFFPGNTIRGISLPDDPLIEIFDFIAKTEAMERGAYL